MASRELSESAYKHEDSTKREVKQKKPGGSTKFNPWGITESGNVFSLFAVGVIYNKEGGSEICKPFHFDCGFCPSERADEAIRALGMEPLIGIKVMAKAEVISLTANGPEMRSLCSAFKQGFHVYPMSLVCPEGYLYEIGVKLHVEVMHVVKTLMPRPEASHKMLKPIFRNTLYVVGFRVEIEGQTLDRKVVKLPLSIPFISLSGLNGYKTPGELIEALISLTPKLSLGAVKGLSIHSTFLTKPGREWKLTGIKRNMVLCPMEMYPEIVFANCLKEWKFSSARIVIQPQPKIYSHIPDPLMSEKELIWNAINGK